MNIQYRILSAVMFKLCLVPLLGGPAVVHHDEGVARLAVPGRHHGVRRPLDQSLAGELFDNI